jgi:mRNA interferase HicA
VKRTALFIYLRSQGCDLLREGGSHSYWWNPGQNKRSSIPGHAAIKDILAMKICRDLGVKPVK